MSRPILVVFGTRPEAIKLCPVIHELRRAAGESPELLPCVCVTAQHRELLDQVLQTFGIQPAIDLDCMQAGQTLAGATARMLLALDAVFRDANPSLVVVQGDTATTLCASMAAFYAGIPVAHVEAGLRTGDLAHPFPEEFNRVVTGRIASLHFAATARAARNLRREGVPAASIHVTGNTAIDALLYVRGRLGANPPPELGLPLDPARRLLFVTAHRRESFGRRLEQICGALADLAARPDVQIVFPVHPNPAVRQTAYETLSSLPNVFLTPPLPYTAAVWLLSRSFLVLTDSGGIQEEAPALGKPVLVLRDKTERPEAVAAGGALLTGACRSRIAAECARLLDNAAAYRGMAQVRFPYGDGHAAGRIRAAIQKFLSSPSP